MGNVCKRIAWDREACLTRNSFVLLATCGYSTVALSLINFVQFVSELENISTRSQRYTLATIDTCQKTYFISKYLSVLNQSPVSSNWYDCNENETTLVGEKLPKSFRSTTKGKIARVEVSNESRTAGGFFNTSN